MNEDLKLHRENFKPSTDGGGHDEGTRGLRYLEWTWDPDPADTTYVVDFAYPLRTGDGAVRVEHDRHVEGLFPRGDWLRWLTEGTCEVFICRKPLEPPCAS